MSESSGGRDADLDALADVGIELIARDVEIGRLKDLLRSARAYDGRPIEHIRTNGCECPFCDSLRYLDAKGLM